MNEFVEVSDLEPKWYIVDEPTNLVKFNRNDALGELHNEFLKSMFGLEDTNIKFIDYEIKSENNEVVLSATFRAKMVATDSESKA